MYPSHAQRETPTIGKRLAAASAVVRVRTDADALCADLRGLRGALDVLLATPLLACTPQWRDVEEYLKAALTRAQSLASAAVSPLLELLWASERDPLTHLPNRAVMLDRLEGAIASARRHKTRFAVIFVDVDRFKDINDEFGHAVGDAALRLVGYRLRSVVRDADSVSRYGGDEFIVLLSELVQPSDALTVAAKILSTIAPSQIGEHVIELSVSIGVSVYPENGDDGETLIERADEAMYQAKRRRRGSLVFAGG